MMHLMRKYMKTIIWVIVISFVGFIFAAWGAKYSQGEKQRKQFICEINGEGIDYSVYSQKVFELTEDYQTKNGKAPDADAKKKIEDDAWDKIIADFIVRKETEKRGLTATDNEIYLFARNMMLLPTYISDSPNFQTQGKFDDQKYFKFLATEGREVTRLIAYYRETIPRWKLQTLIAASVRVPAEETMEFFKARDERVEMKVYLAGVTQIVQDRDLTKTVSDARIKDYFKKNQKEFEVDERRFGSYIFIQAYPSSKDTASAKARIDSVYAKLQAGKKFEDLAKEYSQDTSTAKEGGEIGFIGPESRMDTIFMREAFSLKKDEFSKPFVTALGYDIVKVYEERPFIKPEVKPQPKGAEKVEKKDVKKEEKGKSQDREVRVRHILIRINTSEAAVKDTQKKAQDILKVVKDTRSLKKASKDYDLTIKKTREIFADKPSGDDIPKELNDFYNYAVVGENSTAIKGTNQGGDTGFYIGILDEIRPSGIRELDEVKERISMTLARKDGLEISKKMVNEALELIKSGKSWDDLTPMPMNIVLNYFEGHPALGKDSTFVQTAFTIPLDKISNLFKADDGYFFFKVNRHIQADMNKFPGVQAMMKNGILQGKEGWSFEEWLKDQKSKLKIIDNRERFKGTES